MLCQDSGTNLGKILSLSVALIYVKSNLNCHKHSKFIINQFNHWLKMMRLINRLFNRLN